MTGLYIDISDYYTDPLEEEVEIVIEKNEEYDIIPSSSNFKNWGKPPREYTIPPQGKKGRFLKM